MNKSFVAVLMGSDSDLNIMEATFSELKKLEVPFEGKILSAHRTPELLIQYIEHAEQRGAAIFIAAAGLAAHLAGSVAAHTLKPVIGVPINASGLGGLDALLSTVQMPGGIPVACTTIGKSGAKNAALLATQILAISDDHLKNKLVEQRAEKRKELTLTDQKLQERLMISAV